MRPIDSTPLHLLASYLYQAGTTTRNLAFDLGLLKSRRGELPSICVGNVVVGGSGKTPFTQYLASSLSERGFKPAVLLRGYKGTYSTPCILDESSSAKEVGDEAILHRIALNASIPIVVARSRLEGISLINKTTNADLVILDDGLQHRKLLPNAGILLLNASSAEACKRWHSGHLLPYGYLRESISSALLRTHCIVQMIRTTTSDISFSIPEVKTTLPVVQFILQASEFIDIYDGSSHSLNAFTGESVDAAAAIANPEQFFSDLRSLSISLNSTQAFNDHHDYSNTEIEALCIDRQRPLLVTEKDSVKLKQHIKSKGKVFFLKTTGKFRSDLDSQKFWEVTLNCIRNT